MASSRFRYPTILGGLMEMEIIFFYQQWRFLGSIKALEKTNLEIK